MHTNVKRAPTILHNHHVTPHHARFHHVKHRAHYDGPKLTQQKQTVPCRAHPHWPRWPASTATHPRSHSSPRDAQSYVHSEGSIRGAHAHTQAHTYPVRNISKRQTADPTKREHAHTRLTVVRAWTLAPPFTRAVTTPTDLLCSAARSSTLVPFYHEIPKHKHTETCTETWQSRQILNNTQQCKTAVQQS